MSNTSWNCLVESVRGGKYHAASIDDSGVLRGIACNIRNRNGWQLVHPVELSTYEVCTRCLHTGTVDKLPGVTRKQEKRHLRGTTIPTTTLVFDAKRYDPPVDAVHRTSLN